MNTEAIKFAATALAVEAYQCAAVLATANLGKGKVFLGAMQIADVIGYDRNSMYWDFAVSGAYSVISKAEVYVDEHGVQV